MAKPASRQLAWRLAALTVAALSLGPSFARACSSGVRRRRERALRPGADRLGKLGGARQRGLASWTPGPVPADFEDVRDRWERGHIVVAAVKLLGFMALSLAAGLRD